MLSTDGSEGNAYTFQSLRWSPDSKKLAAFRRLPGYERLVHYIESSPSDQVQPKHSTNFYRKPGDRVDFDHPVVFNVETKQQFVGRQGALRESVPELAPRVARGQPGGDIRVQPARPSGLSRDRDRRHDREDANDHRGDAEDLRRVLREAIPRRHRRRQGDHLGVGARRLESPLSLRRRHRPGEEPDHEGAWVVRGVDARGSEDAADLVPRERHARRQGSRTTSSTTA